MMLSAARIRTKICSFRLFPEICVPLSARQHFETSCSAVETSSKTNTKTGIENTVRPSPYITQPSALPTKHLHGVCSAARFNEACTRRADPTAVVMAITESPCYWAECGDCVTQAPSEECDTADKGSLHSSCSRDCQLIHEHESSSLQPQANKANELVAPTSAIVLLACALLCSLCYL